MTTSVYSVTPHVEDERTTERERATRVVLCGSFQRDYEQLRADHEALRDLGCEVLSPRDVHFVDVTDGFVRARHEENDPAPAIEARHLEAMLQADFVWLHAPEGYIGRSAAMELGFAKAHGLAIFGRQLPAEAAFRDLVRQASSPARAMAMSTEMQRDTPSSSLAVLQDYYRRIALQRGYSTESPQDCMLLLTEEVGELARAVRKTRGLVREGGYGGVGEVPSELADVQLYVLHLANVLGVDLASAVAEKERINAERVAAKLSARAA